jgi:hypothetical protein
MASWDRADGGVDGVAEAGIRGRLKLVRVELPSSANARLGTVAVDQSLDLVLSTLDGTLSVYASVAGDTMAEKDFFRWNGLRTSHTIMKSRYDIGLLAAAQVMAGN